MLGQKIVESGCILVMYGLSAIWLFVHTDACYVSQFDIF